MYLHKKNSMPRRKMQVTNYFLCFPLPLVHSILVLPLELQPLALGLAAVRPTSLLLLLLVATQARSQLDINPRRGREPKALGYLDKIQLVHVKHGAEGVRGIGLQVRSVAILRRL